MAGHNKWANIKRRKEAVDKKRAQVFSKLARSISVTAKNDPNPATNLALKAAIERAREYNVPNENIERAISKSAQSQNLEEIIMEAYGPEGTAIIITATTDNKNRTIPEIKKILKDHDAKWAQAGSVTWAFSKSPEGFEAGFPQSISPSSQEKLLSLFESLDDHDDVNDLYTNAQLQ